MPSNFGIFNEEEIAMAMNGKRVAALNTNLRFTLYRIYGPLEEDEIIHSERLGDFSKPDIWVEYKGIRKYISIKSGRATEVHAEPISTFAAFLSDAGMSDLNVQFVKEYCYGDGTADGSCGEALEFVELKQHFAERSALFNKEVMANQELIVKVIERCLFKGSHDDFQCADYVYFGTAEYGEIVSKKQILRHLANKSWSFMSNPHIGPLQFKMHIRGRAANPDKEYKRHIVDLWWANLEPDIRYITRRYNLN